MEPSSISSAHQIWEMWSLHAHGSIFPGKVLRKLEPTPTTKFGLKATSPINYGRRERGLPVAEGGVASMAISRRGTDSAVILSLVRHTVSVPASSFTV